MKNILLLSYVWMLSLGLCAQVQYGTIDYLRTTEQAIKAADIEGISEKQQKELRAMMDRMSASGAFDENYKATFSPKGFTFVEQIKEESSDETEMPGGIIVRIETGGGDPKAYYTDVKTGKIVNSEPITDRQFLVTGKKKALDWTITGEAIPPSELTVGLDLKIATAVTPAGDTITAGYAPSLPVQVGPLNFYGLPGAIITLRIPQSSGETVVFRATAISVSADVLPLNEPTIGKSISLEKFRKEQKKRRKTTVVRQRM